MPPLTFNQQSKPIDWSAIDLKKKKPKISDIAAGVPKLFVEAKEAASTLLRPVPTTKEIEAQKMQSLTPKAIMEEKTKIALGSGSIPLSTKPELFVNDQEKYFALPFGGAAGTVKKVGGKVSREFASYVKSVAKEFAERKQSILSGAQEIDPLIKDVRLGGSYGKGAAKESSDIDLEFSYDGTPPEGLSEKLAGQFSLGGGMADAGVVSAKAALKAFKGFKDYTTVVLDKVAALGKSTMAEGHINSIINNVSGTKGIPQRELSLYTQALFDSSKNGKVNVQEFADNVHSKLLKLTNDQGIKINEYGNRQQRSVYRMTNLPESERTNVNSSSYREVVYETPIKTSAGHSGLDTGNYFAHVRRQDIGDKMSSTELPLGGKLWTKIPPTRQIIEVQSDLMQKGRLENENIRAGNLPGAERAKEIANLEPYRNTWYQPVIRSEVNQAAKDGIEKIHVPSGQTAMNIEGLGGVDSIDRWYEGRTFWSSNRTNLTPDTLKVGDEAYQAGARDQSDAWIITDVLGEGKFKAVPKQTLMKAADEMGISPDQLLKNPVQHRDTGRWAEEFDISGKVDTSDPVYKFYEDEIGKFLQKNYGAKQITDEFGNKWWELDVPKESAKKPVQMFGKTNIQTLVGGALATLTGAALLKPRDAQAANLTPEEYIQLTNDYRQENGLQPLKQNDKLTKAANEKLKSMIKEGYFSHTSPGGKDAGNFIAESGYSTPEGGTKVGENLSRAYNDNWDTMEEWKKSESHNANLINPNYTEIGMAEAMGEWEGKPAMFIVQMFAEPIRSAPTLFQSINEQVDKILKEQSGKESFFKKASMSLKIIPLTGIDTKVKTTTPMKI